MGIKEQTVNGFWHGGDYNPEQWLDHPEIIAEDFQLMKQAHVNTITIGVFAWSKLEPREGEFDFAWLDDIFARANANGIQIILATPSGARPQWLSETYPEVNRVDEYGRRHHHGFRHNHCYSSPVYRQKVQRINRKLAQRYGQNPALKLWHVSNEYSGMCYCHYCQENWRKWLRAKYGSLEAINRAWYLTFWSGRYSSWSQVKPPSPLGETKVHGMDLDWKRFCTDMTIDFFQQEIKPLRAITPNIPVTTNFMAEGHDQHQFVPLLGMNYRQFARQLDVVSWDSYPDWHNNFEPLAETAMKSAYVHDQYYSLKKQPFLVMESTPSFVNWHAFNKSKRPGMHILSSFQQIAQGSDSTLYFQWRQSYGNSEKFHGAVVGHDDDPHNRVFQEVAQYGQRLAKIKEVQGATKQNKVAILFDWESNWALERGGGYGRPTRRYLQTLQNHYAVFWEQDIGVDILTPDQDFSNYALVIAPMLYLQTATTMSKLQDYVKQGGTLIGSYFSAIVDSHDLVYTGPWAPPLQKLFGVQPKELEPLYPDEHNQIEFGGHCYPVNDYAQIMTAQDSSQVLASYQHDFYQNTPAVVTHKYGQGQAYYLAMRSNRDFLRALYQPIIARLDLANPFVTQASPEVSAQCRVKNQLQYYFVMNFSKKAQHIQLTKSSIDVETGSTVATSLALPPYGVRILKVKDSEN